MDFIPKCPKCKWEPDGKAYWNCENCSHEWDMFSTAARCPNCSHQHHNTQCIEWEGGCDEFSPHLDWYEGMDEGLSEISVMKGEG